MKYLKFKMAGIYIHIPFCKKKCFYCDFYTSLSLSFKKQYLRALKNEISLRNTYLSNSKIDTIYFGGGTPSVLTADEINDITEVIYKKFDVSIDVEFTLEANPDDLTASYLSKLKNTAINRLSVGIQSFFDDDLILMNRRHSAGEAIESVKLSQEHGFENISGDLIYGLPKMTGEKWQKNLQIFFDLQIPHLSAYHLTYEPNTVFNKLLQEGKINQVGEGSSIDFFNILIEESKKQGFIHYEISSFAKNGYFSKHNSSYWKQSHYLGLGASAHSYNGNSRQWNISNLKQYIEKVGEERVFFEIENLSNSDKFNDYIITSIRTIWGIELDFLKLNFGKEFYNYFTFKVKKYISSGHIKSEKNKLVLTKQGLFISDLISEELLYLD